MCCWLGAACLRYSWLLLAVSSWEYSVLNPTKQSTFLWPHEDVLSVSGRTSCFERALMSVIPVPFSEERTEDLKLLSKVEKSRKRHWSLESQLGKQQRDLHFGVSAGTAKGYRPCVVLSTGWLPGADRGLHRISVASSLFQNSGQNISGSYW